jgi:hypothetical protein
MRTLTKKKNFTKAERIFAERLKTLHIPFRTKVKINDREIDFIVKNYAIDIDGHEQVLGKNEMLVKSGYIPIHINNNSVKKINISYLID